jgi:hypothetical protein
MEESIVFLPLFPIAPGDRKAPNLMTIHLLQSVPCVRLFPLLIKFTFTMLEVKKIPLGKLVQKF